MVHWSDQGIIVEMRKFGENKLILTLFTQNNGLAKGIYRPSKKTKSFLSLGVLCACHWQARLETQLGLWQLEVIQDSTAQLIFDPIKMGVASYACQLLSLVLPERNAYPLLFDSMLEIFQSIPKDPLLALGVFELTVLESLGYGFTLDQCAATGGTENLSWLSPKSGQAVSYEAGLPYQDKLFKLPQCMLENGADNTQSFLGKSIGEDELKSIVLIAEYFILKHFNDTCRLTDVMNSRRMLLRKAFNRDT